MAVEGVQNIIAQTGGCGRYQILIVVIVHSMKCIACFSTIHMVFGGKVPDWRCLDVNTWINDSTTSDLNDSIIETFKTCTIQNRTCSHFQFDDSISTVISEWALICNNDWIPTTITSIQMAGVFAGNIISGQMADLIGRKPPLFLAVFSLVVLNIIAAFSTSWLMFAIIRFFIGFFCGVQFVVQYNLMSEFAEARWRAWIVTVPSWAIEMTLFALVAWALKDWRQIHLVTAATGLPWLFTYWFIPESYRWYLSHSRTQDAKRVINKVARVNGQKDFKLDERDLAVVETGTEKGDRRYTFFDLVRSRSLLKLSFLLFGSWITLGLGYYGLQFGVPSFSGNLYVNIFLSSVVRIPINFLDIYLMNRFGRKPTAILLYSIFAVTAATVGVLDRFEESPTVNTLSIVCAIIALTAVSASWSPVQTMTIEGYPTVVRNIGYGTQNTMARIGAILGPQLLYLNMKVEGLMYFVCSAVAVLSVTCILQLPETSSADLGDTIKSGRNQKEKEITISEKTVYKIESSHI